MITPKEVHEGVVKIGDKLRNTLSGEEFYAEFFQPIGIYAQDMYVLYEKKKFCLLSECEVCE